MRVEGSGKDASSEDELGRCRVRGFAFKGLECLGSGLGFAFGVENVWLRILEIGSRVQVQSMEFRI